MLELQTVVVLEADTEVGICKEGGRDTGELNGFDETRGRAKLNVTSLPLSRNVSLSYWPCKLALLSKGEFTLLSSPETSNLLLVLILDVSYTLIFK